MKIGKSYFSSKFLILGPKILKFPKFQDHLGSNFRSDCRFWKLLMISNSTRLQKSDWNLNLRWVQWKTGKNHEFALRSQISTGGRPEAGGWRRVLRTMLEMKRTAIRTNSRANAHCIRGWFLHISSFSCPIFEFFVSCQFLFVPACKFYLKWCFLMSWAC